MVNKNLHGECCICKKSGFFFKMFFYYQSVQEIKNYLRIRSESIEMKV